MSRDVIEFDMGGFFRKLEVSAEAMKAGAILGVHDATDDLLAKSREEAPLEHGTLRQTAFKEVSVVGDVIVGEVIYSVTEESASGERFNYALRLHEMGRFKNPTTAGTRPKFLERPLKTNAKRYNRMIVNGIKGRLR